MQLIDSQTYQNLAKSFAAETQARARYQFMEYGMRNEGYNTMAEIVDKIGYQEFNHARMFYTKLQDASDKPIKNIDIAGGFPFKQKWDILTNLKFAAEDERVEAKLYVAMAKTARREGFPDVAELFEMTAKVEQSHQAIFEELYTQMKDGTLYKKDYDVVWTCSGCGHTYTGKEAWQTCPLCQAKQGFVLLHLQSTGTLPDMPLFHSTEGQVNSVQRL